MFGMLQVLPNTALWHRLEKKGVCGGRDGNINQTTLEFYPPTLEDIARNTSTPSGSCTMPSVFWIAPIAVF